ncbi:MAG: hypothetical protein BBJ60_10780 [Desulfobacterales bacterium S7086C20]|nr:MAG: hypothetical protein BBJ60_10780 [Desulfobacterales bacterium S7086C20]
MSLKNLLTDNKSSIVKAWCDLTLKSYPEESQGFFKKKDQFGNPVGHSLCEGIESTYDALLEDADTDVLSKALDGIIRIRAIQEFSPSQAISFLFGLKQVIRDGLGSKINKDGFSEEWAVFETKIDGLALLGFDIYSKCRQQIYDIRVESVKRRTSRLLTKAGLVYEIPEGQSDQSDLQENIANINNS